MRLDDFDRFMRDLLEIDNLKGTDPSLNGVQVGDLRMEIETIAFAVDASFESFRRASEQGAELLFVHHGLLWNKQERIVRNLFNRIRFLIEHNLALYAVHLPLDMHPELGNNIGIAKRLGLEHVETFGMYKGVKIGFKGALPEPASLDEIKDRLLSKRENCLGMLPFGPKKIKTIGIVSGGDPKSGLQAIEEELDLFITGDASHEIYHECLEGGINVLFAGHYATEVWGIQQVAKKLKEIPASRPAAAEPSIFIPADLKTVLLDIPTGL
jgi:dinuclear metal center YbgI/SA1388 family protein